MDPEVEVEVEVENPEVVQPPEAPAQPEPPAPPSWEAKRLAKKTAELAKKNEDIARLQAELAAAKTAKPGEPVLDPAQIEAEVARRLATKEFNDRANAAAEAGRKEFGEAEFNKSVETLLGLIDRTNPTEVQQYSAFVTAALETGEAPKLIHLLGQDPETAERIMAMTPVRQGIELARLAAKEPEELSKAPKPITPVRGVGVRHEEIDPRDSLRADKLSTAEWIKRREAQVQAARSR